jgi:hypothetical protein
VAAGGVRDVDFAVLSGEAQRIPFLTLPAVLAAPGLTDDFPRNVVAELFLLPLQKSIGAARRPPLVRFAPC